MPTPIIDVFKFSKDSIEPFYYLGAIWTIECKPAVNGDHWECTTTAPFIVPLAMAEDAATLKRDLRETGVAALRNTKRWYLFEHLVSLGFVSRMSGSPA
jgi:hypothetical protein